jgi:hypothetical protein
MSNERGSLNRRAILNDELEDEKLKTDTILRIVLLLGL